MTILMLQKDSPESGEHIKWLEHMWQVSRKDFTSHFQKAYFNENPLFLEETDRNP